MSSTLSFAAIRRIIYLAENDDRPSGQMNVSPTVNPAPPPFSRFSPPRVNSKWWVVDKLYRSIKPPPPLDYLHSLELALVHKGEVDDEDVSAIFAHGKPLEFWGCPPLIVSKILVAFRELQKDPTFLDVTITSIEDCGAMMPSEVWSQGYKAQLPCYARTAVRTIQRRSIPRWSNELQNHSETVDTAVEKFHIASDYFGKLLIVELHYELVSEEQAMLESMQE